MAPAAHTTETPANGDVNNGAAITTGVRFTVDEDVDCAGIAFWVPATNSGTYTVGLYETDTDDDPAGEGTGTQLATDSVGSGSVTGGTWAEVLFDTPVALSTGTIYTAARHASSGRYVSSSGAFTSAGISGNGVNLLQDGTDPNPPGLGSMRDGVFHEGASLAYPNSTFGAADYFVDIVLDDGVDVVDIDLAGTLPALTAAFVGGARADTTLAGALAALTASFAGDPRADTALTGVLPALTAAYAGGGRVDVAFAGVLPTLTAQFSDSLPGTVVRPNTGTVTRPGSGTVTRPFTGIVSRP